MTGRTAWQATNWACTFTAQDRSKPATVDLLDAARHLDAGMVVKDVDAAVPIGDVADQGRDRSVVGDVELKGFRLAAGVDDPVYGLACRVEVAVGDDDDGALARHRFRSGPSDAGSRAGDDRRPP